MGLGEASQPNLVLLTRYNVRELIWYRPHLLIRNYRSDTRHVDFDPFSNHLCVNSEKFEAFQRENNFLKMNDLVPFQPAGL
jgi:hypothetical protein